MVRETNVLPNCFGIAFYTRGGIPRLVVVVAPLLLLLAGHGAREYTSATARAIDITGEILLTDHAAAAATVAFATFTITAVRYYNIGNRIYLNRYHVITTRLKITPHKESKYHNIMTYIP